MKDETRLALSPTRPTWLAMVLRKSPNAGLGWAAKVAPLMTGSVGSGVLLKRPFTAWAILATPEGAPRLGDLDLSRLGSWGT